MHGAAIAALAVKQSFGVIRQLHRLHLPHDDIMGFPQQRGFQHTFKTGRSIRQKRLPALPRAHILWIEQSE